ncbi:hypothetical protein [Microcoleus sp. herbarium14]
MRKATHISTSALWSFTCCIYLWQLSRTSDDRAYPFGTAKTIDLDVVD